MNTMPQNAFEWAIFYKEFADKLLTYKTSRVDLLTILKVAHEQARLRCQFNDFKDIDPFTVFGSFNKGITKSKRMALIKELAELMDIKATQPSSFDGIPVLMNLMAIVARNTEDIDDVWGLFEVAINYADNPTENNRNSFIKCFDTVSKHKGISWNITMGLFWIRPYFYLNLDGTNRVFLLNNDTYSILIKNISKLKRVPDAETYLKIVEKCREKFSDEDAIYHSFPELSSAAWITTTASIAHVQRGKSLVERKGGVLDGELELLIGDNGNTNELKLEEELKYKEYSKDDFLSEVFLDPAQYEILANLLKKKRNLILQGAPGVGKSFAAKRLAYSIIGVSDTSRVMTVQFHQSYSYEDFIMGFRPTKDWFELAQGPFYTFCKNAQEDLERDYFFIIDEINRGNLSKIFGELLMLIENDKRGERLRLLYSNELFSVPKNVYIIGLMNTADRSLAMIDYALRRRFAFYDMEPAFDSSGFLTIIERSNNDRFALLIERIKELNEAISKDESLGDGFRIGHSYFCTDDEISDYWLASIIDFEILPLLNEYWFDEKAKIERWAKKLRGVLSD